MSRLLTEAEWLTPKQALALLRKHDPELTMEDLAGYCTELKLFQVYVRLRMAEGEELDSRASVYGVGEYLVLNPEDALHGADGTTLYLLGDVFDAPDPAASRLLEVEWELSAKRSSLRFLFRRTELEKVIASSVSAPLTSSPPPHANHLVVISELIEMLKDDSRPRHNQQSIVAAIEEKYKGILGLGATNLRNLFADANRARKAAEELKRPEGTKIRLDLQEIQME
ncbi:hypothetical protein [Metapseudomonas otitidis]|uniref:hypothetical protein n=1 Tax=Metapseudomonas otitidis TaxID=319939 RepID=UPI001AAFB643|nr:hypothetical protein [Pseudomonas otitidis]MBO2926447.1 hypothetical protein [Pseudomonas otitidis]QZX84958.1 hypothetical protein K6751_09705 [Pseudomonas otitidis]